jgi:membrane-bound lytic murein transglycosylase D
MNVHRTGVRIALTLGVCALLAACATQPSTKPRPTPAVVTPLPEVPPPPPAPAVASQAGNEPWTSIVASDVMPDCTDAPLIRANAAMYTRYPAHFEQLLKRSLPLIIYVHKQLQAAGIPGEFSMLPMLESSYNPAERSRHGDPAGMWQLMPRTARLRGLTIDREYDGRLDPVASTQAAIRMLKALEQQFGDWRLVDMAYNAGPYALLAALRERPDATAKPVPDLPLSHITLNHLARLMALSCILRRPERFHVTLPQASSEDELAAVELPAGTRLGSAAKMADLTEARLRQLNPGYRGARIPSNSPRTLLLPVDAARSLATTLAVDASEPVAQVNTTEQTSGPGNGVPLPDEPAPPPDDASTTSDSPPTRHHRVRKGETLWSIAHHYHVSVGDLKRWNGLHGSALRIGKELRIRD